MSGGIAYVLDPTARSPRCNREMVDLEPLSATTTRAGARDLMIERTCATPAAVAARCSPTGRDVRAFVKVMPRDYKRVLEGEARARERVEGERRRSFAELVEDGAGHG
jgi:glutamate synthase (NADPH/NADH) large chain